jgi:uncharacterized protein with HEPN domain
MSGREFRAQDYCEHILEAIRWIESYTSGMTEDAFVQSRITRDAVTCNFLVIGEASRNLLQHCPEFVVAHPNLPLTAAYGMRNQLAHGYFRVSQSILWKTLREDLPLLRRELESILSRGSEGQGSSKGCEPH